MRFIYNRQLLCQMLVTTCLTCIIVISTTGYSQTGAGGVGNSSTLPLWFDANELNLSTGSQVYQFDDISGNSNHLTQTTSTRRPIFNETGLNGLPVVTFDGVNDYLTRGATSGLDGSNLTYFVVFQRTLNTNSCLIDVGYTGYLSKWSTYSLSNNRLVSIHRSPDKFVYHIDSGSPTFISAHITPTNLKQYRQGTLQQSLNATYTAGVGHNLIRVGAYNYNLSPGYYLNGFIAEIIVFNTALNNLERVIVENYLGTKYGMAVPSDFYAYESTHNIGLIGIGDNGPNTQTTAQGYGILSLSGATGMSDNEYLMIAHTNNDLTDFTTTGLPPSLPGYQYFTRTWRAGETGDVGNVTLTFDLSGGHNFGNSSSYNLLVDTDNNFSDATIVPGTYNGLNQTVSFTVDLNDGDYFTLCGLEEILEIHSVTSDVWSNPATWDCNCIPSSNDLVYIDPFNTVTVDIDAETDYLSVEPNATLEMVSPVTLSISGDWDLVGSINFTDGEVAMVGSTDQYVDAGGNSVAFHDVEINNSTGGTVTFYVSEYTLNGTLTLTEGTLDLTDPGTSFIVNSTSASEGGRIGPILGSSNINGEISVRRFIPSGIADWRDICSPVIGSTFVDWDPDIYMSGPSFPDGCASGDGDPCYKSVRYTINGTENYVTNVNDPITNSRGYYLFLGDDLSTFSGATLTSTGTINGQSDVVKSLTTGWYSLGNPFVSPILFSSATRTSNVGNYFYVYDPTIGDYQYYDGSTGLGSIPEFDNGLLATGQGFWVYLSGAGTLTFHQTDKTNQATYIRSSELEAADHSLYVVLKQEGTTYQTSVIFEASDFTSDGADSLYDMMYLETGHEKAPRMYVEYPQYQIRKNFIQNDQRNKSFDLVNKIKAEGYYTLSLNNIENFADYRSVLVYDKMTGEFIDLTKEQHYVFYSDVFEGSRFTLIFTNLELVPASSVESLTINESSEDQNESMNITQMGHVFDIHVSEALSQSSTIQFVNLLGESVYYEEQIQLVQGSNIFTLPAELIGVHILVVRTGDSVITRKVVL